MTKPTVSLYLELMDCVDHIGSARYVSKFDLVKGYWQVPLTNRAKDYLPSLHLMLSCSIGNALSEFEMHLRLSQRLVNRILYGMSGCEAYLDDIVLYSSSWSEHLNQIKELFSRLAKANLTVNSR